MEYQTTRQRISNYDAYNQKLSIRRHAVLREGIERIFARESHITAMMRSRKRKDARNREPTGKKWMEK